MEIISKMSDKRFLILAIIMLFGVNLKAQKWHSDNGDGTYTNPLIPADFPDPDVIRVGDTYYMVNTTMFIFPGVTVLKSKDLVNWEYCSNAVPRFDFSPCYDLDGCNRYGHGQWATSIRYHNGKFYLLFLTLDEGGFLCTATNAGGKYMLLMGITISVYRSLIRILPQQARTLWYLPEIYAGELKVPMYIKSMVTIICIARTGVWTGFRLPFVRKIYTVLLNKRC